MIYKPIEDGSNDDVWLFLMQLPNPWGHSNKELMGMYRGASADGECPLVVDTSTPSCGSSRFGCWVCTLVDQDKSMAAMIQNDVEKEWMLPMLELRNELDFRSEDARARETGRRDFRRMSGKLTHYETQGEVQLVRGPYTQEAREYWLRRVLETQQFLRENAPPEMRAIELITAEELAEIRRIWVVEKHEIEDRLPTVYREVTGESFPGGAIHDHQVFDAEALALLREACGGDPLHYEMIRNLIDIEMGYRAMTRRRGMAEDMEREISRCFYSGEEDALAMAREGRAAQDRMREDLGNLDALVPTADENAQEAAG